MYSRSNYLLLVYICTAIVICSLQSCASKKTSTWVIEGDSMEPNLVASQSVEIEEVNLSDLQRGDVIIYTAFEKRTFLKRLIGLPGETIAIHDGKVFINGKIYNEPYLINPPHYEIFPL